MARKIPTSSLIKSIFTLILLFTVLVANLFYPHLLDIKKVFSADNGTIEVCQILADGSGSIVNGSAQSGSQFRLDWLIPTTYTSSLEAGTASGIPSSAVFTTPLTLNTKIEGFPDGPGVGGNNAQCVTLSNLTLDQTFAGQPVGYYYYRQQQINGGSWGTPKYNDGWTSTASISTLYPYDSSLYDSSPSNDPGRNVNSDGNITLGFDPYTGENRPDRRLVIFNQYGLTGPGGSGSCTGGSCSIKEIGTIDSVTGNFNRQTELELGRSYWVRLTVRGRDISGGSTGGGGSDIMLAVDSSDSMGETIPVNSNGSGGTVQRYISARNALKQFITDSVTNNDYLGLSSFSYCRTYNTSSVNMWWAHEDRHPTRTNLTGRAVIHIPLQQLSDKNYFQSQIDKMSWRVVSGAGWVPNFCTTPDGNGTQGGSSLGVGISTANTMLTPVISDPDAKRFDGTSFRDTIPSMGFTGRNDGPRTRSGIRKYVVLAADGGDSGTPYITDQEIDRNDRSILETAKYYGVTIHVISYRPSNGSRQYQWLSSLASETGGQYIYANSDESIRNAFINVRSSISGSNVSTPAEINVNEIINVNHFKIDEPIYGSNRTFRISRPRTGSESSEPDLSATVCPDSKNNTTNNPPADGIPDCISNKRYTGSNLIGYNVNLGPLANGETRYIYFRVTTTQPTLAGSQVNVDSPSSTITYQGSTAETLNLANELASIKTVNPYFQITKGDVYSHAAGLKSIQSLLPADSKFINQSGDLSLMRGASDYGDGAQGNPVRNLNAYTIQKLPNTYQEFIKLYSDSIDANQNITGINSFGNSGYYIDRNALSGGNQDYIIRGGNWRNQTISNKHIVFFVPGNLYIQEPFSIAANGSSSLTFIVGGNLGIAPTVTVINGIYIVDGVLDTACDQSSGFNTEKCPTTIANTPQLVLNGIFYAASGFNLDRTGLPGSAPGELFNYKPEYIFGLSSSVGKNIYSWKEKKD